MYKVLAIVLFLFAQMSMEVRMPQPTQSANSVPVWLKGAYSNSGNTSQTKQQATPTRGTHRKSNPYNQSKTDALKNKAAVIERTSNRDDGYNKPFSWPAWMTPKQKDYNPTGATRYDPANLGGYDPAKGTTPPPTGYGGTNPNPEVTKGHLRGNNQPFVVGQDAITQVFGSPYDAYKGYRFPQLNLQPVNPRTVVAGPGTLDTALWDQPAESGFGTNYGGNWGGGGGGGGWQDWGSNDYPAWMRTLMGLNSWNIK